MKKYLALLLAVMMVLGLAACTVGNTDPSASTGAADGADADADASAAVADNGDGQAAVTGPFTVGVCQLAPHPALDQATQGFIDVLEAEFGDQITISNQNAGGEVANCATIIDGFVADGVNLILANATPSLTTAAAATSEIPILGTAITNYGVALGLDTTEDKVLGGNISGTSDLAPLDQQAAMIKELFPDKKNVGLVYCSAEANSLFQVETVQGYLEEMGYTCTQYSFADVNDLPATVEAAVASSEVIYIPTDNQCANNTEAIAGIVLPAKIPVVAGEKGICEGCGVVTLSIDYYELGEITGQQAVKILKGETTVQETPIGFDTTLDKLYNAANCEALGITPPEGYQPI